MDLDADEFTTDTPTVCRGKKAAKAIRTEVPPLAG